MGFLPLSWFRLKQKKIHSAARNHVLWARSCCYGYAVKGSDGWSNPKSAYRNPKQIRNSNAPMTETGSRSGPLRMSGAETGFGHLDFGPSILPFDLAQGGESFDCAQDRELVERVVEPFRVSYFELRIYRVEGKSIQQPYEVLSQRPGT